MGKGGAVSVSEVKTIFMYYTYIGIWILLSFTMIIFNNFILNKELYNWPFPISLAMIHMAFCSSIAFAIIRIFKLVEPVSLPRNMYIYCVLPIGAFYAISLWLSNSAYIYLSVSFIQMLKALIPFALYSIVFIFKSPTLTFNMIFISFALALAVVLNHFNVSATFTQLGVVALETTKLIMFQALLTSRYLSDLYPITSLYYLAPCCFVFLFLPWLFLEFPVLKYSSTFRFDSLVFGTNSFCAFAFNFAMFFLLWKTSPLTMLQG